jgi:hypothetical protein
MVGAIIRSALRGAEQEPLPERLAKLLGKLDKPEQKQSHAAPGEKEAK